MSMNPFSMALDSQRRLTELASENLEKATVADERVERMQEVGVGETPGEVVYTENKLELIQYESLTEEQHDVPILVAFALINRPYIMDLQPDRSVIRRLLEAGHDVYLIDWNEPSHLDQHLGLADYVDRYIDNCVDVVRERSGQDSINILGYCMGGTMSAMYAALHPEKVRTLGLMAAGLYFDGTGGVLEEWGSKEHYDPEVVTDALGNMPSEMLDVGFALMDPIANFVSKYVRLYDNIDDEDFVENFARMEKWLGDGIDVAGRAYKEFLTDLYQENKLYNNEMYLDGEHIDLNEIDMPVIQVMGQYDHLIPPEASKPFNDVIASEDVKTIEYPTGHIGLSVSGSTHEDVWPEVAEWFLEKSSDDPAHLAEVEEAVEDATGVEVDTDVTEGDLEEVEIEIEDEESGKTTEEVIEREAEAIEEAVAEEAHEEIPLEDVDPAGAEGSDLEEVKGIGPTYAERLREAGFDTIHDLADSDAETVAEAANVSPSRAEDWISQAQG